MVTSWPIGVDQTPWVDELFSSLYRSYLLNIHVEKTSNHKAENPADKFSPHSCLVFRGGQQFRAEGYQRTGAMYPRYSGNPGKLIWSSICYLETCQTKECSPHSYIQGVTFRNKTHWLHHWKKNPQKEY